MLERSLFNQAVNIGKGRAESPYRRRRRVSAPACTAPSLPALSIRTSSCTCLIALQNPDVDFPEEALIFAQHIVRLFQELSAPGLRSRTWTYPPQ